MGCDKKKYTLMGENEMHDLDEKAYQYGEDIARRARLKKKVKGLFGF